MTFRNWLDTNQSSLAALSAGLLGGKTEQDQISKGFQGLNQAAQQNKTLQWLEASDPELAGAVKNGALTAGDAFKLHYQRKLEAEKPKTLDDFTVRNNAATQYGLDPNSEAGRNFILTGKLPDQQTAGAGGPKYYGNPVLMQDGNGNTVVGQLTNDGQLSVSQTPDGYRVLGIDDKERDKKLGANAGENIVTLDSMNAKLPSLEANVAELGKLADKATYTTSGKLGNWISKETGYGATDGAIARTEYIAKIDNQILPLLKDTFGAQFTDAEGLRLRATLGDPDLSPAEKKATLNAFIIQKKRDIEALNAQVNGGAVQPSGGAALGNDPLGLRGN